jgi:hypothetical protein
MSVDWRIVALAALVYLPNLYCLYRLWFRMPGSWAKKLLFSAALLIPIFGLLLYGGAYVLPEPHGMDPKPTPGITSYRR